MRIVAELRADARQFAATFDEDVLGAIDENVGDRRVAEQRFDRAETSDFPDDLFDDFFALRLAERSGLFPKELSDRESNLMNDFDFVLDLLERFQVEPLDQTVMKVDLELIDGTELIGLGTAHPARGIH